MKDELAAQIAHLKLTTYAADRLDQALERYRTFADDEPLRVFVCDQGDSDDGFLAATSAWIFGAELACEVKGFLGDDLAMDFINVRRTAYIDVEDSGGVLSVLVRFADVGGIAGLAGRFQSASETNRDHLRKMIPSLVATLR